MNKKFFINIIAFAMFYSNMSIAGAQSIIELNTAILTSGDREFTANIGVSDVTSRLSYPLNTGSLTVQGADATSNGSILNSNGVKLFDLYGYSAVATINIQNITLQGANVDDTDAGSVLRSTISDATMNNVAVNGNYSTAVYSDSSVLNISKSSFSNNDASSSASTDGGAIYIIGDSTVTIKDDSSFTQNTASGNGGAIFVKDQDYNTNINISNTSFSENAAGLNGGAIDADYCKSLEISDSTFTLNKANGGLGGAIRFGNGNATITGSIFTQNSAQVEGGAIYSDYGSMNISGSTFEDNTSVQAGGAVFNGGDCIMTVGGTTFSGNKSTDSSGGAIYNRGNLYILEGTTFENNIAQNVGGAIENYQGYVSISGANFSKNQSSGGGGAITTNNGTLIINGGSSFTGNTTSGSGGAIDAIGGTLTFDSSAGNIIFGGDNSSAQNTDSTGINDINLNQATLNIDGSANKVFINGGISGDSNSTISKDNSGELVLNSNSDNSKYLGTYNQEEGTTTVAGKFLGGESTIEDGTLNWFGDADSKDAGSTLIVEGGTLNVGGSYEGNNYNGYLDLNNASDTIDGNATVKIAENSVLKNSLGTVTLGKNSVWAGEINLAGGTLTLDGSSNRPTASYTFTAGDVNLINGGTLYMNSNMSNTIADILTMNNGYISGITGELETYGANTLNIGSGGADFSVDINADAGTSDVFQFDNINGPGTITISDYNVIGPYATQKVIPLHIFESTNISSDVVFKATDKPYYTPIYKYNLFASSNAGYYNLTRTDWNSKVFRGQVATLAMYNSQLTVNNALFDHVYLDSESMIAFGGFENKYAGAIAQFSPYQYKRTDGGLWTKTYGTFERLTMTQGLDVGNNIYGQIIGADFPAIRLGDGWNFLPTAYVAYNGGHQHYDGVSMYQNGGQAGGMGTFMKGDFIGSFLAYGGGYFNEMTVDGFKDETGNWFAGTAVKTAYNFHPAKNIIIQPNALVSYNIFGKQSWGSDFGALSMNSGFLNGINAAPGLNIIYGGRDWSIYGTVQYMYNINDKLNGSAGDIDLPNVRMRHGYIEYGFGATKTWKERLMSYGQFVVRNGGRTGIGFQLGLTFKL